MPAIPARLLELAPVDRLQLEAWLAEFEEAWDEHLLAARVGRLPPPGQPLRLVALIELVKIDLERNWQRGRRLGLADYLARYPELGPADAVPADLRQAEEEVRRQYGESPATLPAAPDGASTDPPTRARPAPPAVSRVPCVRGYELLGELGRGGMGVVYKAWQASLGREVAVKVLPERFAHDSGTARRFFDEAHITAQLQHPGIPSVHDLGTLADGRPFLAMKLIKGQTLEALLAARTDAASGRGRFVAAFEAVCQALAYAHAHNVIHRDLKPANVMVGAFGEVQVMDWGLAKVLTTRPTDRGDPGEIIPGTEVRGLRDSDGLLTQAGSVMGTPAFMPPEQAAGLVGKVDRRSDVFGLGAILAVILTGQPPFVGASVETTRGLAARGDVADCLARLDSSGGEPELVALCKRCLAPRPADRPADAGDVARAVAALWEAADERARRAELDRAQSEARALERRKRRRLALGAAAALAVALLGGLVAVLTVQRGANADLEAKNRELAEQQAEVEARFELARKAIATFHTGVSADALLKNDSLGELRTKLLKEAAGFYADLEKRLQGKTDTKSRKLLASGYAQLGALTEMIGDKREALVVQRKALAVRQALAAQAGADVETRLDVARSLQAVATLMGVTGDPAGAMEAHEAARDIAVALEAESPTNEARDILAQSYNDIGVLLSDTGKPAEALAAYEKARDIRQKLAEANPAVTQFQYDLARSYNNIAVLLFDTATPEEALAAHEKARDTRQKLADSNPSVPEFQRDLARSHKNIGTLLLHTGKPAQALASYKKAQEIQQVLADANRAVTQFQDDLAGSYNSIGALLAQTGKPVEALAAFKKARDIAQKLAEANAAVTQYQNELAGSHNNIGVLLSQTGKPAEALAAYEKARDIVQKLADANPTVTDFQSDLASRHFNIGWQLAHTGKPAEALAAYEKARDIQQKLADANPTVIPFQRGLAASHNNIGSLLGGAGKSAESLAPYEKARDIQQKLADANPTVTQFQHDLALSHNNIGVTLSELGKPAEALAAYEKARDIQQKLANANPAVTQLQSDLAASYSNIGWQLSQTGKPAEALQAYQSARDILQKLADANPAVPAYSTDLSSSHYRLGSLLARQGRLEDAFASLNKGQALCRQLADAHPETARYTLRLGYSHAFRGAAHVRARHPAEAAADLRRALELWAKNKDPDAEDRFERARALALLAGLANEAKSGVTTVEATTCADQAVAAVRDALQAGWGKHDELKDSDFDALRKRPDFQQLLKDLRAKATATSRPPEHTPTGPPKQ
jgi:serine/threonine protein kinase